MKLNKYDIDLLINKLKNKEPIPEDYKYKLFPTLQKEYELTYAGKMRKEDILANEDGVFPVPLQIEKMFNGNEYKDIEKDWKNMIVFGDNLQFLKTCYENKDPLIKNKVKGKVKLIYIDPPFATESDFQSSTGEKAYTDKMMGAKFIEFLRRRLIISNELLAPDGCIFVHLDWKKGHYIKIMLDEIFGEHNFLNEIIWHYTGNSVPSKCFPRKHDLIYLYKKSDLLKLKFDDILEPYSELTLKRYNHIDENGRRYKISALRNGKQEKVYAKEGKYPDDVWDIPVPRAKKEVTGYPTQKPEKLLEKIILSATEENDLVFDFFGGSGTLATVAEKLKRRWLTSDIGKLSFYTIQKRILTIKNSSSLESHKKEYGKKPHSFITVNTGLYDLEKIFQLKKNEYINFVMNLFEIDKVDKKISGISIDGEKKDGYYALIFPYWDFKNANVDEEYLEDLHSHIGSKIGRRLYIIAPANYVDFITDYYEIGKTRYYFLKVPYQIIKELHKVQFKKFRQPQSKKNVNDLDDAIGFHFIRQPEVKSSLRKLKKSVKISLSKFYSNYMEEETGKKLDNFESLAMILLNKNYDGNKFVMDDFYFAEDLLPGKKEKESAEEIKKELKKQKSIILEFKPKDCGKKMMIIYIDIYGNEFKEIFEVK